jgi:hypothetical protein
MKLSNDINIPKDLVVPLLAKVEVLESENAALRAENTELHSRLNLNNKNSHKPHSSARLSKKTGLPKGQPPKKHGRFGHKVKTLKIASNLDEVVIHHLVSSRQVSYALLVLPIQSRS